MVSLPPEYISLIGQAFAYLITLGVAIWRISARFARHELVLTHATKTLENVLRSQKAMVKELGTLEVKFSEREKDTARLEAGINGTRSDIHQLIKDQSRNQATLEALWGTLQKLFPNQVPKRASDRL